MARRATVGQTLMPSNNDIGSPRLRWVSQLPKEDQEADSPSPAETTPTSRMTSHPRLGRTGSYQEPTNALSQGKHNLRNRPEVVKAIASIRIAIRRPAGITEPDLISR